MKAHKLKTYLGAASLARNVCREVFYPAYASYFGATRGSKPHAFIFVLSHMRSGSTLLTHLLASHPDVCGYGETHIRYFAPFNFKTLIGKVLYTRRKGLLTGDEKYVLDKVLHDRLISLEHIGSFARSDFKIIFLIREPHDTLASMVRTLNFGEKRAIDYYSKRLVMLEKYASRLTPHARCAALTHEQLLNRTDEVFRMLEQFLGLESPLSETYEVLPTTGRIKVGDPSSKILTGKIVRGKHDSTPYSISDVNARQVVAAYERCRLSLNDSCLTIGDRRE